MSQEASMQEPQVITSVEHELPVVSCALRASSTPPMGPRPRSRSRGHVRPSGGRPQSWEHTSAVDVACSHQEEDGDSRVESGLDEGNISDNGVVAMSEGADLAQFIANRRGEREALSCEIRALGAQERDIRATLARKRQALDLLDHAGAEAERAYRRAFAEASATRRANRRLWAAGSLPREMLEREAAVAACEAAPLPAPNTPPIAYDLAEANVVLRRQLAQLVGPAALRQWPP
eukprot:8991999-Pyramimonas_sp.AAC.1